LVSQFHKIWEERVTYIQVSTSDQLKHTSQNRYTIDIDILFWSISLVIR